MRRYYQTLRLAVRSIWRHRMRSALTCLGIVIGIASVIAMMEVGKGTSQALQQSIANIGANMVQIDPGATSAAGVSSGDGSALTLVPEDGEAILRECNTVCYVAPGVDFRMQVIYGNRNWAPRNILGTTPIYLVIRNWDLQEGEPFTDDDVSKSAAVCLIGQTAAGHLFGNESPVGKEVLVHGITLKIVGLLRHKGANMMGRDQDDFMIAPWTTVKFRLYGSKLRFAENAAVNNPASSLNQVNTLNRTYPNQQVQLYSQQSVTQAADTPQLTRFTDIDDLYVSVKTPEEIPKAIKQMKEVLRRRHHLREGESDDFNVRDWTEISELLGETTTRMTDLLLCVALTGLGHRANSGDRAADGGRGPQPRHFASVPDRGGHPLPSGRYGRDFARPRRLLRGHHIPPLADCFVPGRGFCRRGGLRQYRDHLWLLSGVESFPTRSHRSAPL